MVLGIHNAKRKIINSPVILFLCLFVSVLAISGSVAQFPKERKFGERVAEKQKKLDALRVERDVVAHDVAYLESERGREEYIRRLYGAAMVGEMVVVVSNNKQPEENNIHNTVLVETSQKRSGLSRWFFWEQ